MAAGTGRYVRFLVVAFFIIMLYYFVTSSRYEGVDVHGVPNAFVDKTPQDSPDSIHDQTPAYFPDKDKDALSSSQSSQDKVALVKKPLSPEALQYPLAMKPSDPGWDENCPSKGPRMNATFVTLARNRDIWDIAESIRHVEDRFNRRYNYDWVFLNDEPFGDEFKKITTSLVSGKTHYGLIPPENWSFPEWIDQEKAAKVREDMAAREIIYGDSISYRHMCRFESGFFFRQPLMMNYEYYWRVEPSVKFLCDIHYDPFRLMAEQGKKYSFVLSLHEYKETIESLWDSTKKFMKNHPEHIAADNGMDFVSEDGGETYNLCHYWSNFEIGSLEWLRSKAYTDFFESLDRDGGFFYERWGDAPVHSIAASIMLNKSEIHFFDDIAYFHNPFWHCPTSEQRRLDLRCNCDPSKNFDWHGYSCTSRYFEVNGMGKPEGWEKYKDN